MITTSERPVSEWSEAALKRYTGGLGNPSKMPGKSYGIPAAECATGSKLRAVAGSTCSGCYALKGNYKYASVQVSQYRRLESIERPLWVAAMAELITRSECEWFRWHDSGDIQSVEHFARICQVARKTPHVRHWLPTREYRMVAEYRKAGRPIPSNLVVRMSAHMVGGQVPRFGKPLTISSVSTSDTAYPTAHHCPARHQGNECGDCRACWSRNVAHVDYHAH